MKKQGKLKNLSKLKKLGKLLTFNRFRLGRFNNKQEKFKTCFKDGTITGNGTGPVKEIILDLKSKERYRYYRAYVHKLDGCRKETS